MLESSNLEFEGSVSKVINERRSEWGKKLDVKVIYVDCLDDLVLSQPIDAEGAVRVNNVLSSKRNYRNTMT